MVFDIVTFGSGVIDTFIDTEFNDKTNSFNYKAGSKILAHNLQNDIGGGATNTAVAFARFGFRTGCICKIGNDNDGKNILDLLKKENIKFLGSFSSSPTGHSIILDSKSHSRTILTYKGPGNDIKLSELPVIKTKWLYYSSILKTSLKTQLELIKKLKKDKTKLAFNPSEYLIENVDIKDLLSQTSILILNKDEAKILTKKNNKKGDLLKSLQSLGPEIVVVTDKNNPAFAYDGKRKYSIMPNAKIKVVERTGAGDAFAAGFVAAIIAGKSIDDALKLANKESESVIQHFGAKNKLLKMKLK